VRATDLTREQLHAALKAEAAGQPAPMFLIRDFLAKQETPYQYEPCTRCNFHVTWRERQAAGLPGGCWCEGGHEQEWDIWMFLAGRGTGKTYTGSTWSVRQAMRYAGSYGAIIAPTHKDLRNTLLEGPTGIIRALPRALVELTRDGNVWNQSAGEIKLKNGSVIRTLAAEKPDRIRGANLNWVWADEMAAWSRLDYAWEQLEMATRVGSDIKFLVTTTPRPLPLLKYLVSHVRTVRTEASTYDNTHLSARFMDNIRRRFEGTTVGLQELHGKILEDIDGALWSWAMVEDSRCPAYEMPPLERIVVAVDPSGGGQAEVGIIVVGLARDVCYVLADYTMKGSPHEWGMKAVMAYHEWKADRIVGERNFGGDMVESTIRACDPNVSYKDVTASRGKVLRAEPVQALYQQKRVKHMIDQEAAQDKFALLEHQLTSWVPNTGMPSPDRLDAMVWAVTELVLTQGTQTFNLADLLAASPSGDTRSSPWRTH